jgi:8-oxo-dGTP pyrophosphatase MutT (NUDIX family)
MLAIMHSRSVRRAVSRCSQQYAQCFSVLASESDQFGGIIIDSEQLPPQEEFRASLQDSLSEWRGAGAKGVWLQIPSNRTELMPCAIDSGFEIHHAQPGYIQLTAWLPKLFDDSTAAESTLPGYATHFVGVGGVVLNDANELLVVSERYQPKGFDQTAIRYKLPGGHVDRGESLACAVEREIFEETGVGVEFESIICFRHNLLYPGGWGNGDLYFAAKCRAIDTAISMCESELVACEWLPVQDFLAEEGNSPFSRELTKLALESTHFQVCE